MANFIEIPVKNIFQRNICSAEDRYVFTDDILAVFDGHGGKIVSEALSTLLEPAIRSKLSDIDSSDEDAIRTAIIECFDEVDKLTLDMIIYTPHCGSTCTMVVRLDNKLVLINLGDSNLVLYVNGEINTIMKVHLYSNPEEKVIIDSIEETHKISIIEGWAPQVLNDHDITMVRSGILKSNIDCSQIVPTRNFGHRKWKHQNIMSVVPSIEFVDMNENDIYELLLASDGVFDILVDYNEIYPIINGSDNKSKSIVEFAEARWRKEWNYKMEGFTDQPGQKMGVDDITAIYCRFTV